MSFEGYEQRLCKNGHYEIFDVYEFSPRDDSTCYCGEKWAWFNLVDCTNEPDDGFVELEIDQPAQYETICEHCGSQKIVADETYKIPERRGVRAKYPEDE